jgi:hypothetical protein
MYSRIEELHHQIDRKYIEIMCLIAEQLGYRSDDKRAYEEADDAIERWAEHVEAANCRIEPRIPLQRLPNEYDALIEQILSAPI